MHLLREGGGCSKFFAAPGLCRGKSMGGDVGVEQSLDVVNKSVFEVDSGRLELEGELKKKNLF